MTVIGGMSCDGYLLIGSDSAVEETSFLRSLKEYGKLERHQTSHIVWGTSGDEFIGDQFTDWFRGYSTEGKNWLTVAADARDKLAQLNGAFQLAAKATNRFDLKDEEFTDVLIVGYVDDTPEILELLKTGEVTLHISNGRRFSAIGAGSIHARIIFATIRGLNGPQYNDGGLKTVLTLASKLAPKCAEPIHLLKISSKGIDTI